MKKVLSVGLVLVSFMAFTPDISNAYNEDECSIWLCLPAGFPSGCGKAHSAFKKRIKKGKSPLPSFSSCSVDDSEYTGQNLNYKQGFAAKMPNGTFINDRICRKRMGGDQTPVWSPYGCTGTVKYVKVFTDNIQMGGTVYYSSYGYFFFKEEE